MSRPHESWLPGENWEAGYTGQLGRRWHHDPWGSWELSDQSTYLLPRVRWVPWWKRWLRIP